MTPELTHPVAVKPWRPTPTIASSVGLHCAAGVGALIQPELWAWAAGAVAANHVVLTAMGMWPRSTFLGPNVVRLPQESVARGEICLTFDDGPDPQVTPAVLELLDARGVRATFFCIAEIAHRHPELCREIARRGHAVENHSNAHHPTFPMLGLGGIRREIASAQAELSAITGTVPRYFRPPAGLRNPFLDPVLHALGLRLVTWTRRGYDTREADARLVAARLTHGLAAGDILLLHDGHSARTAAGVPVVLEVLPRLLDAIDALDLRPVTLAQALEP